MRRNDSRLVDMTASPHDIDAEQAVLASMILDAGKHAPVAAGVLTAEDFYRPTHGVIFDAIVRLANRREPVDHITLKDELNSMGMLNECGGVEYLMALTYQLPSASRIKQYAEIVKDKARLRKLIQVGSEIVATARESQRAVDAESKSTELLIKAIADGSSKGFISMGEAVAKAAERIEEYSLLRGKPTGPITGLQKLDRLTMGLDRGLNLIAAATGVGKTMMLLQIARFSSHIPGVFFQLEMDAEELAERMIVSESKVDSYLLRAGAISIDQAEMVADACNNLSNLNLHIYDEPVDISRMMALAQQSILEHGTKYILVDYMGLIEPPSKRKSESRNLELGSIARGLQQLSRRYNVPVIAAAQLSRRWMNKPEGERRPSLQDLRDSGELEQHAYRVIFLHDPNATDKRASGDEVLIEVDLAKNRGGPIGIQKAFIERKTFRFYDVEERYEDERPEPTNETAQQYWAV